MARSQIYIVFLRGINVGGNSILPMKDLAALCSGLGFKNIRTYINSGNVILESLLSEEKVTLKLEKALEVHMKKPISVMVRTGEELESIIKRNPFKDKTPSQVGVTLFANSILKSYISEIKNQTIEEVKVSGRELFVYYPKGMGQTKIKFPTNSESGTVRNINTITKLIALLS